MKCPNCGCNIGGAGETCPLCHEALSNNINEQQFPEIPPLQKKHWFSMSVSRLYFFITLVIFICLLIINLTTRHLTPLYWSIFAGLIFLYGIFIIKILIPTSFSLPSKMLLQLIYMTLFVVSLHYNLGLKKECLAYIVPITIALSIIVFFILAIVFHKRNDTLISSFVFYSLSAFIPLICYWSHLYREIIPTLVCLGISAILNILILLFFPGILIKGFKKRFHF